ncbi:helix-turn-helix transcriptional regulator [Actinoplanes sp. NPDC051861]|uniref:helix-turn-helix domain-containing protein n=1 Tax=Actinoplanes sp. NPDC051861 TaxID=3155170 RepID=UPI0034313029
MTDLAPTELGQFLEAARRHAGISGREAARRSGISDSRWRQIIRGEGGRPPAVTVVAAALGVGAEPDHALKAAGMPRTESEVESLIAEAQRPKTQSAQVSGLAEEIERIRALPLPPAERIRVAQGVIAMYEDLARERQDEDLAEKGG